MNVKGISIKERPVVATEQLGKLRIEICHRAPKSDDTHPLVEWWDWTVTRDEPSGEWSACAEGVSWRSVDEARRCARAVAETLLEGEERLDRAVKYLDAKRLPDGYRWQWDGARDARDRIPLVVLEATEAELVRLGTVLGAVEAGIAQGSPSKVYGAWVREHARESKVEAPQ